MKKIVYLFLFLFCNVSIFSLFAQIPDGYYDAAIGKKGKELQQALSQIISDGAFTIDYGNTTAARAMDFIDGYLYDIYSYPCCQITNPGTGTSEQCKIYSFEHLFCQSWFNPVVEGSTMYNCNESGPFPPCSDLHHTFPTDHYVNSSYHGSAPFAEVAQPRKISQNGSKWGYVNYECYDSLVQGVPVFEPVDEFKGDVARALLYISIRYMNMDETFGSSVMTEKSQFKPWAIEELKKWHLMDPVSQKERDRNNIIHSLFQFNRNPLIDHPEIVTLIWGSDSLYSTFNSPHNEGRPTILDVDTSERQVVLTFNMELDPASAENPANYTFTGGICVSSVTCQQNKVIIELSSPLVKGTIYHVYTRNVKSLAGKHMMEQAVGFLYGPYGSRYIFCAPPREVLTVWTFDDLELDSTLTIMSNRNIGEPTSFWNAKIFANGEYGSSFFESNQIGVASQGNLAGDPRKAAVAGKALSLKRRDANGKSIVLRFSTKGWREIMMTFADTRSSTGFTTHRWEWSIDGVNYDSVKVGNTISDYGTVQASAIYMMRELDLRYIQELNDKDSVFLRLTVDDAPGATGTNAFDNFVVYGEDINWEPPVGIKQRRDKSDINLYPNPNNGTFEIKMENATQHYSAVQIFDITGKMLIQKNISDDITYININEHPNGLYFAKIIGKNGNNNSVKKIILSK